MALREFFVTLGLSGKYSRHKVTKTLRKHKDFCYNNCKLLILNKYYVELRLLFHTFTTSTF